jgi:hypothetical protein
MNRVDLIERTAEQIIADAERALSAPLVAPIRRPNPDALRTLLPAALPDFTPGGRTTLRIASRWGRD